MSEDSCRCIDCGGDQPGHSTDCVFMNELHGDLEAQLNLDDVMRWPDGTWCYRDEKFEFTWMSDDYEVLYYDSIEWWEHMRAEEIC